LSDGVMWAYDGAEVLRSTDGGATWRTVLPTWRETQTSLQVQGAFFSSAQDAWAVTAHEWPAQPGVTTVWRTSDGGATWEQGASLPEEQPSYYVPGFDQFAFADALHGFGFGVARVTSTVSPIQTERQDVLWASGNSGRDWRQIRARGLPWQGSDYSIAPRSGNCSENDPFSLTALSPTVLLLTDSACPTRRPGIWLSTDGGSEWSPVHLPAPPGGWDAAESWQYPADDQDAVGAEVANVSSFPGGEAVVAVTTRPGELLVYRSRRGTANWSFASLLQTGSLSRPSGFAASAARTWELPAPAGLFVTPDAGKHWHLTPSPASLPNMAEVSFASQEIGIGLSNLSMRTTDGGRSWEAVQFPGTGGPPEAPFSAVDFASSSVGWVGGAEGVEATADGGHLWRSQLATPEPVQELSFADALHGWALTADELFSTADGGEHWGPVTEPALGSLSFVQLVSPNFGVGLVCGAQGGKRALVTYDQGRTWHTLAVPNVDDLSCGTVSSSPGTFYGLCFGTPEVGWAVLDHGSRPAVMDRTTDGGRQWAPVAYFQADEPTNLACQGTLQAWVGLNWMENMSVAGDLAATLDGGRTWRVGMIKLPPAFAVPRVQAVDGSPVASLGTSGLQAEMAWRPVSALQVTGPREMVDLWEDAGPACAGYGFGYGLISTTNGGATWWADPPLRISAGTCQGVGLPFLLSGGFPPSPLSISFPSVVDGFVLGPVACAPAGSPTCSSRPETMALIGTADGGRSWRLLARFKWR
jgi:hypothetical protein